MTKETTRTFYVAGESWRDEVHASYLVEQAHLISEQGRSVTVHIRTLLTDDGNSLPECLLTMKLGATAITTDEYEYAIPYEDARSMMSHAGDLILSKICHLVEFSGRTWEIYVFQGRQDGLIVTEIGCDHVESINNFPDWVGTEVAYDSYFKNSSLAPVK
jgi:adenylate cyclase